MSKKVKYFDEFGNPPYNGPIMRASISIDKIGTALFNGMIKNGATNVEIRAATMFLDCHLAARLAIMEVQAKAIVAIVAGDKKPNKRKSGTKAT